MRDYTGYAAISLMQLAAIVFFAWQWLSLSGHEQYPVVSFVLMLLAAVPLAVRAGRWVLLPLMRHPVVPAAQRPWKVAVATTFVPGAEPLEMLEDSLRALVALDYPHDTWVLDERGDPQVAVICAQLGARYFSRAGLGQYQSRSGPFRSGTKYGNYNAWLHQIGFHDYEVVVTFDPDHVPRPEFLDEVLGCLDDPGVGYVQVAQAYYNQEASLVARGATEESCDFNACLQPASYGRGYCIINGSHNTHRVSALKDIGGFADHDADDLLMTLRYRCAGWRGVYVPKILARGLAPVDWPGYLTQQRRWARSILDLKLRRPDRGGTGASFSSRAMSLAHGCAYLYSGVTWPIAIATLAAMLALQTIPDAISLRLVPALAVLLGSLALGGWFRQRFYLESQPRGLPWRAALLNYAKWPYLLLAVIDVLRARRGQYVMTRKVADPRSSRGVLWPHGLTGALVFIAWAVGVHRGGLPPLMHAAAWTVIIMGAALIVMPFRTPPPPFDRGLLDRTLMSRTTPESTSSENPPDHSPHEDYRA